MSHTLPARRRRPRPLRVIAVAALLASAGLAPTRLVPPVEGGLLFSTTTTAQAHNAKHVQGYEWPLGTTVHLYVKVTGSGTRHIPTGLVEIRRYSGAGCSGTLRKTVRVKLDGGEVDALESAFKSPTPEWVYFNASYLGSATFRPSATLGCYGVNITATPKVTFVMHDADHDELSGDIAAGTIVHPRVTVTGDWGTPVGAARGRLYWDDGFEEPCTGAYLDTEFANLEGGIAEVKASWTTAFVRKGWVQVLYSIDGSGPHYSSQFSACVPISFKGRPNVSVEARTSTGALATTVKVGAEVELYATVTGPGGEVTGDVRFRLWNGGSCSGTPAVNRVVAIDLFGHATTELTMASAGTKAYRATYLGSSIYLARSSACKTFSVTSTTPAPTVKPPATAAPSTAPEHTAAPSTPAATTVPSASEGPATPEASSPLGATTVPSAAGSADPSQAPPASSIGGPTPAPSPVPAVSVVAPDMGLLIVALFVFGLGLLAVGVVAGVLISRRSRAA